MHVDEESLHARVMSWQIPGAGRSASFLGLQRWISFALSEAAGSTRARCAALTMLKEALVRRRDQSVVLKEQLHRLSIRQLFLLVDGYPTLSPPSQGRVQGHPT
jgi:hypothetical protein